MKRILITTLLFIAMLSSTQAQRFLGSIIGGINLSQVDGDEVYGFYKVGANVGAGISLPLDEKQCWSVTLELLYAQHGSYKKSNAGYFDTLVYAESMFTDVDRSVSFDPRMKCKLQLDYVEVPVMAHYEDPNTGWAIGAGFSWGRLVRAKEVYNGFQRTTNARSKTYSRNDWSIFGDVKIRIWKGLKFNIRYQYSLAPIRKMNYTTMLLNNNNGEITRTVKDSWTRKLHNNTITIRFIYVINEKFVKDENGKWKKDISSTEKKRH